MSKQKIFSTSIRTIINESVPSSVLTLIIHTGAINTLTLLNHSGEYTNLNGTFKQRGGVLVFGKTSGNVSELHAIRLHETVEATTPENSSTSKIETSQQSQPFRIYSDSDFIYRDVVTPSVISESEKIAILTGGESLKWSIENINNYTSQYLTPPLNHRIISSTSGVTSTGKRVVGLFMDSGNIYAGVEE